MTLSTPTPATDAATVAEAHALRAAFLRHPTLASLRAATDWPALSRRLAALIAPVRRHDFAPVDAMPAAGGTLRVVQWNIEHGNRFAAIAGALAARSELAGADLVTLNEVDLGMARSGNRDVAAELARHLGMHAAWAALFLESTRGRDDDSHTAVAADNAESLFGLALLSRWPVTGARLIPLPGPERELFERERMTGRFAALLCEIAHPVRPFVAVTVHLEVHRSRAYRALQMQRLLETLATETRPVLLTGDWNTHTFDRGERWALLAAAWALVASPSPRLARRLTHPDEGPHHEPLFDELRAAGFEWRSYTDYRSTLGVRFSRLGEVHAMPGPLRAFVTRGLAWAESRAQLRLDWIATRGFAAAAGSGQTLDVPNASDHSPIAATLKFAQ